MKPAMQIPLSSPDIGTLEKQYVMQVLDTPHLSLGPKLQEFEEEFARYIGCNYAIAVNSGTSGLHLSLKAIEIQEGDEVITTPFSFVASANCIIYERAVPVFADIDPETLALSPEFIEEKITSATKAILPVHVFGHPADMIRIMEIAEKHNLYIVEDACEAIGAEIEINKNVYQKTGTFGELSVFAFYPNKQITTGEGGIIVTNNPEKAALCRSLRNQGRFDNGTWLQHKILGYNYRLSDINCALGLAQLSRVEEILAKRTQVANWYSEQLKHTSDISLPSQSKSCKISWFVYVIKLAEKFSIDDRNLVIERLRESGIGCNAYFPPIHLQPFYQTYFGYRQGDFPVTESISARTVALPFYSNLSENQIDYVCTKLADILNKIR